MELLPRAIVGLTGAFGSGCTTSAKYLRDTRGFVPVRLSDSIRAEWAKNHKTEDPSRLDLQRIGDELRQKNHAGILVEKALSELETKNGGKLPESVVIDGIRNLGEITYLRDVYGFRFTLTAILASSEARWARIGTTYTDKGLGLADFVADDQRDQNEETDYGQQVELCVDKADILINNTVISTPEFQKKLVELIDLAIGKKTRSATQAEILMNIAFSSAHSSKCIKRHVGAVVADPNGQVVSAGYNENPLGTNPCIEEPEYHHQCFRDIMRNEHFETLSKKGARCPVCGEKIIFQPGPPWRCKACAEKGAKTNLESFFFPDRAMNWCTAVHAEVWAILAAGERSRGGVLYTTTFPCAQCAEKIVQAGIAKVVFTEPYPDVYGANRLNLGGIELEQFEGVRSSSFERIFSKTKPD